MAEIGLFINFLLVISCLYLLFRNNVVGRIELDLLDLMFQISDKWIDVCHLEYLRREKEGEDSSSIFSAMNKWREFHKLRDKRLPSYASMLFQFNNRKYYFDLYRTELWKLWSSYPEDEQRILQSILPKENS